MGVDVDGPDARFDGVDAAARRFARGAESLSAWSEALSVAPAGEVASLLRTLQAQVLAPGPFHALVHDDLAAGRQCVVRGGRLLLLDWENAKHAHALRDLAKVLVGKFERWLESDEMVRMCPDMDPAVTTRYRRELARAGGPDVSDAEWGRELSAAVLFNTVVQVGALVGLYGVRPVTDGLLPNVRGLVYRMGQVLHGLPGWEDPRRILLHLAGRIA
jgi:aminoglycoside phosphotransferase (APT) family kinase protein